MAQQLKTLDPLLCDPRSILDTQNGAHNHLQHSVPVDPGLLGHVWYTNIYAGTTPNTHKINTDIIKKIPSQNDHHDNNVAMDGVIGQHWHDAVCHLLCHSSSMVVHFMGFT